MHKKTIFIREWFFFAFNVIVSICYFNKKNVCRRFLNTLLQK